MAGDYDGAYTFAPPALAGERSRTPAAQAHLGYASSGDDAARRVALGVSGHYGRRRSAAGSDESWAAALDFDARAARVGVAGELFTGRALAAYGGGGGQEGRAHGGFFETRLHWADRVDSTAGVGFDRRSGDILPSPLREQRTVFGNVIVRLTPELATSIRGPDGSPRCSRRHRAVGTTITSTWSSPSPSNDPTIMWNRRIAPVACGVMCLALAMPAASAAKPVSGVVRTVTREGVRAAASIVYAERLDAPARPQPGRFVLAQQDKAFVPGLLAVPVGSTVDFPNRDPIFHNVFSLASPAPFDLGLYRLGASRPRTFSAPAAYRVFCNIHPQMSAFILVAPTSHVTVADAAGAWSLDLPPGPLQARGAVGTGGRGRGHGRCRRRRGHADVDAG